MGAMIPTPVDVAKPHGWIQWKGTEVCMDFHCECGHHSHFDDDFCYFVKCPECGSVFEMDGHVTARKLSEDEIGSLSMQPREVNP